MVDQVGTVIAKKIHLWLEILTGKVNRAFIFLGGTILLVIMVIIAHEIFRRYYLQDPSGWTFDVSRYLFAYVVFLSLAPALERGSHVKVEIIYSLFPKHIKWWISLVANVMLIVFSFIFFWYLLVRTASVIADSRQFAAFVSIQMKYVYIIGPIGVFQFFLTALVKTFKDYYYFDTQHIKQESKPYTPVQNNNKLI